MKKPLSNQRKLLYEYKKTLTLSDSLFEIGIGTLLGDASIQTQNSGKSFRIKYSQSNNKHRDYIFHLHEIWNDWVLSPPFYNQKRDMWSFQTISHPELRKLAELFVLDSQGCVCKKHIKPHSIHQYVTPRALAYWFMDDGGKACYNKDYTRKGLVFNTQGFLKQHVELLCEELQVRYSVKCWIKPNKNHSILVIGASSYETMTNLIKPYLIESMIHKLPV